SNSMGTMMTASNTSARAPMRRRRARLRSSLACASLDMEDREAGRRSDLEADSLRENRPMRLETYAVYRMASRRCATMPEELSSCAPQFVKHGADSRK